MANCNDCLCVDVCKMHSDIVSADYYPEILRKKFEEESNCPHFKDRTRFVELPYKVGDTVYFATKDKFNSATIDEITITENGLQFYWIQYDKSYETTEIWDDGTFFDKDIGKTVFLTPEAAEKALNSSENPNSRKEKTNV